MGEKCLLFFVLVLMDPSRIWSKIFFTFINNVKENQVKSTHLTKIVNMNECLKYDCMGTQHTLDDSYLKKSALRLEDGKCTNPGVH